SCPARRNQLARWLAVPRPLRQGWRPPSHGSIMKRAPIRGSCLLLSLLLIGGSAAAAPSLSKRYTHYTLTSSSLAGLEAEMARRGPRISGSGERHPGATRVEIKASVDYTAGSGRCSVSKVRVSVDARITLPRWKPRRMPSSEEQLL